jgi:hypothetical protein
VGPERLRAIYREAKIEQRRVTFKPFNALAKANSKLLAKRQHEAETLFERYQFALNNRLRIIFIDEVKFQGLAEFKSMRTW